MTNRDTYLWRCLRFTAITRAARDLDEPRLLWLANGRPPDGRRVQPSWLKVASPMGDMLHEKWPHLSTPAPRVEWDGYNYRFEVWSGEDKLTVRVRTVIWPAAEVLPADALAKYPEEAGAKLAATLTSMRDNILAAQALAIELRDWLDTRRLR